MFEEQRADPRERLTLPLRLECGQRATTRDISAAGLFFEIEGEFELRGPVQFELEIAGLNMRFTSCGEIVRVEKSRGVTGVAVRLVSPHLERFDREEVGGLSCPAPTVRPVDLPRKSGHDGDTQGGAPSR